MLLVGSNSGSKLSGKPIIRLFLDEEKDYPRGATGQGTQACPGEVERENLADVHADLQGREH